MPITILRTSHGVLDAFDAKALGDLRSRVAEGRPKILVYLHGGLVPQSSAETTTDRLSGPGPGGFNAPREWEQVYVVWRTGLIETLRDRWIDLYDHDRLYRFIVKRLIAFISSRVSTPATPGRSVGARRGLTDREVDLRLSSKNDAPFADYDDLKWSGEGSKTSPARFADELRSDLSYDREMSEIASDISAASARAPAPASRATDHGDDQKGREILARVDAAIREEWKAVGEEQNARGIATMRVLASVVEHAVKIGVRVIARLDAGRDHGLHATVVEEVVRELYGDRIGAAVWGMMKDAAHDHFAEGALGSELVDILSGAPGGRVLVVGHSAGAIWASDLLEAANARGRRRRADLVLLAPAVGMRRFAEVLDVAERGIGRFRLFAMRDVNERRDAVLGKGYGHLYPSSLLYLVSGLFEKDANGIADAPLLGMERFLQASWVGDVEESAAVERVRAFLAEDAARTVFSIAAGEVGLRSGSLTHGGFDEDADTLASVATFFD